MRGKTVTVRFNGQREARTGPLFQYDYGQVIVFADLELPVAYEVHFGDSVNGETITMVGGADGCEIPNDVLKKPGHVYAWVYLHEGADDGETEYVVSIPVTARGEITDAEPTPEQQTALDAAIAALNAGVSEVEGIAEGMPAQIEAALTAAKESGEFDGPKGDKGDPGPKGDPGSPGSPGDDGFSPTVEVTEIEGGHEVAITDVNGTHTFDVMDGEGGGSATSPTATVVKTGDTAVITITDKDGTTTASISDGQDGQDGQDGADGVSPTATVSKSGNVATISITDKNGTTTAAVTDGTNGQDGQDGSDGTDGVTFTPSVSSEGVISWTNDGGRTNPQSVNIKGPQGIQGIQGETGPQGPAGDDYILTAQDKADIAAEVNVPVQDVQVAGTSVLSNGVANVPKATASVPGVITVQSGGYGIWQDSGDLRISPATGNLLKEGNNSYHPIVPAYQHSSMFYGLAKAAGDSTQSSSSNAVGTYTESAKSAISQMLNAPVTVSGTTPSITAKAGVQYVCGEVSTLTIVVPESGCIDVIFESGSTPTVLTVTPPSGKTMEWPDWFDPDNLEANATYEINILNGTLGAVGVWT